MTRPIHGGDADPARRDLWALLSLGEGASGDNARTVADRLRQYEPSLALAGGIDAAAQLLTAIADTRQLGPGCFAGAVTSHPSLWAALTPTGRLVLTSARELLAAQDLLCPACVSPSASPDGPLKGCLLFSRSRIHREALAALARLPVAGSDPAPAALDVLTRLAPSRHRSWAATFTVE